MELKEALQKALANEKKGYNMYLEASVNSKNEAVRNIFKYLAEQELHHIQRIEEFGEFLAGNTEFSQNISENVMHFDEAKSLFSKELSQWKKEFKTNDDLLVIKKAMDFEKWGYDYYKKYYEMTDGKSKDFFRFLEKEEDMHFHLLQNMQHYMENPKQFHAENEDWFFEG